MNIHALIRLADEAATDTAAAGNGGWLASLLPLAMPVLLIVLMYFLMIRPQQKKQKEEQKMRNNLRVGDELTTIGGIKGRVVSIKDDTVTIETSNDRTKIVFEKAAIGTVHTKHEEPLDDDDDDD
ncbi:MAG: preprotein translocase subunit YajC, partial [Clostridia bacterium]|nr:preprotein translocase subunit YajC [Clostridia bacterium]